MLHNKRVWSVAPAESAEWLAEKLTQFTWCGCNGFSLGGRRGRMVRHGIACQTNATPRSAQRRTLRPCRFVNDATCADGAQEYGVLRRQGGHYVQIESLTFSWMNEPKALDIIRRVLVGEFDDERYGVVEASRIQTPEEHGRCHLCM